MQSFKPIWNVRAAFIGWKVSAKKACVKIHIQCDMQLKYITTVDYMYMYPSSPHKNSSNTMEKIRLNSLENLTQYYLLTCSIVVNVIVWEIGRGKQAAGQSRAPGWVMWTKCLPRDTVQPMEAALRNSNEIICKHRKLRLHVSGKVFRESGPSICIHMYCTCI